jgi:hypothetical protein
MNEALSRPFTEVEIKTALFQMSPLKALGSDGFNVDFFQKNWDTVVPEVCTAILHSLNHAVIDSDLNYTYLALIPKTKNPLCVTEFRPISLCNVLYKILSKVLTNRLKVVLPHIISSSQNAFILGRLITDNILASYETLHMMHSRMGGKRLHGCENRHE